MPTPTSPSHIHAIEVERLDRKPLNVRATGSKRVEVNSLHLAADPVSPSERNSIPSFGPRRKFSLFTFGTLALAAFMATAAAQTRREISPDPRSGRALAVVTSESAL